MIKYTITEKLSLLDAVTHMAPDSTKTTLRSWIKEGRVLVDGTPVTQASTPLHKGQEITIGSRPRFVSGQVRLLYEDRHLVVIDKPAGLLSVATPYEIGATAHAILKEKYRPGRVYPVHRLDQETSGVMMFALSEKGRDRLKEMLEKHEVVRHYIALVEGDVSPKMGTWSSYQYEDSKYYVHNTQDKNKGKWAVTHYETKRQHKRYSILDIHLETGRKNQIRAHCEMAGFPIAGDKKYGAKTDPIKRLCLHAYSLAFHHPVTGKAMHFTSSIPPAFLKFCGEINVA